jgi:agmatine deiminase
MVEAIGSGERVCINVQDAAMEERVRRLLRPAGCEARVSFFRFPTDDAWVRDHGPIFVRRGPDARLAAVDFRFDAWGRKYPPWDRDDAIPAQIAAALGVERIAADFVLEGGSVDGDGAGTVLTSEACLLNANRLLPGEPARTRDGMEQRLAETLGAERVVWLGDGIVGDDTDGHVDDVARFVAPGTVVAAHEPDPGDPNHEPLADNLERLGRARDARGRALDVVRLPMPPPVVIDGVRCPASYANFYLANGLALVPVFDSPRDAEALAVLGELLPDRQLVPIPSRALVIGLGAVHCLTQQEPATGEDAPQP